MANSFKKIVSDTIWGILSKVFDAAAKFLTIPLLVSFYGKHDYGIIALVFSLNAYLRLMDMGMNIGSIRFFAMWIAQGEWNKIGKVSRASIVFYGAIGIINGIIFIVLSRYGQALFNISPSQEPIFKAIMLVLAASTIFNWASNVISQLLTAHNEIGWVNKVTIVSSILNFLTAFLAIKLGLPLSTYFFLYVLSTLVIIPLNIYKLKVYNMPLRNLLSPKWDFLAFKEILNYGVAILAMGVFQFTADNLRPLLLGKFSINGLEVLTDFRVIQTVIALLMTLGGVFRQVLLPSSSKMLADKNEAGIHKMVYEGTKYITIFLSMIVFIMILNSEILLGLYMGSSYHVLALWLSLGLITALIGLHKSAIDSLILASGQTRFLVYISALGCLVTIPITIYLAPKYNVGAAIIGYLIYNLIEFFAYYLFYIKRVLSLDSWKIFSASFFPVILGGGFSALVSYYVIGIFNINNQYLLLFLNSFLFSGLFGLLTLYVFLKRSERRSIGVKFMAVKQRFVKTN